MWDWVLYGNPILGMLVADLTEEQRATIRQVLDGMLRERSGGNQARHPVEQGEHRHRDQVRERAGRMEAAVMVQAGVFLVGGG